MINTKYVLFIISLIIVFFVVECEDETDDPYKMIYEKQSFNLPEEIVSLLTYNNSLSNNSLALLNNTIFILGYDDERNYSLVKFENNIWDIISFSEYSFSTLDIYINENIVWLFDSSDQLIKIMDFDNRTYTNLGTNCDQPSFDLPMYGIKIINNSGYMVGSGGIGNNWVVKIIKDNLECIDLGEEGQLMAVDLIDINNGYSVGIDGEIYKLENGIWEKSDNITDVNLRHIVLIDLYNGWAIGGNTLIKLENGIWENITESLLETIDVIKLSEDGKGLIGGTRGYLLALVDGEWVKQYFPDDVTIIDISFSSDGTGGWILARNYHTEDHLPPENFIYEFIYNY